MGSQRFQDTKVTLYRFPDDEVEQNAWIKSLSNRDFEWIDLKRVCVEQNIAPKQRCIGPGSGGNGWESK